MKKSFSTEIKVGAFILLALVILAYITIDVSQMGFTTGRTYTVFLVMDSAEGVNKRTPVQIAGIRVGAVREISLTPDNKARVEIELKKDVQIGKGAGAQVRSRGVLGDTYIEIHPEKEVEVPLESGSIIAEVGTPPNYNEIARDFQDLTKDLKEITHALKTYTVSDKSTTAKILNNMEVLTKNMAQYSGANSQNLKVILENLASLSADLRHIASERGEDIEVALKRISDITEKVQSGEGTIGRLVNDDTTVEKVHSILDDVKTFTRPVGRLQATLDYHLEYLGNVDSFKNYFNIKLSTHPDKYFLFGVVYNPDSPTSTSDQIEVFDTDGTLTTVTSEKITQNKVRFNAQLAKKFSDFTVRGGLIENTGGFGVDYAKGPATIRLEGYNFGNEGPSMKAMAELNLTSSLYVTGGTYLFGGTDEFTGKSLAPDWFLGAGIRFTDEDISSLIGGAGLIIR